MQKHLSDFSNIHHCCSADKPQSTNIGGGGVSCLKRLCFKENKIVMWNGLYLAWILNPETLSDKTSLIYVYTIKVDVKVCGSIIHYVTHKLLRQNHQNIFD